MAYNNISRNVCITTNDLKSCYENYIHSNARWSEYWWCGVVTIYESCNEWQEEYVLIIESQTLIRKDKMTKDPFYNYDLPTVDEIKTGYSAYLVYINDGRKNIYSKVGYSANPSQRFCSLESAYGWNIVVPKMIYYFSNKGAAETMENYMREYYKKKYLSSFVEKDRFINIHFTKEDVKIFDKKAKMIEELFDF